MRTRRPLSINNSLCHGICNYNCRLCGVNKTGYSGPQEFQPQPVTEALINQVKAAANDGIRIRYIANAGDGEPTLHPDFTQRMDMFGNMIREWNIPAFPAPEVSVVTNGSMLTKPGILDAIEQNKLTLIISFPSVHPAAYGTAVAGDPSKGAALLEKIKPGITKAFEAQAAGRLADLQFHISPPEREIIRETFRDTLDYLTKTAQAAGVEQIHLVMFPATSNRTGLIRNRIKGVDFYKDIFRSYNNRLHNDVKVKLKLSFKRFFPNLKEFFDLLSAFNYPCVWNSQLFIAADGTSICCNDQAMRQPFGNIVNQPINQLMETKEAFLPADTCRHCDQGPQHMRGNLSAIIFRTLAMRRLRKVMHRGAVERKAIHPQQQIQQAGLKPETSAA